MLSAKMGNSLMFEWLRKKFGTSVENSFPSSRVSSAVTQSPEAIEQKLFSIDEPTKTAIHRITHREHCDCLSSRTKKGRLTVPAIHVEPQKEVDACAKTRAYIKETAISSGKLFEPSAQMPWEEWMKLIALPKEIETLDKVEEIRLYGSHLRRIPPEIGKMAALRNLDVYTSYSLHWLPYEIRRCKHLQDSRMSTRALFGNRKTRLPFPILSKPIAALMPSVCSICEGSFEKLEPRPVWTTQRIGTDIVPLLAHSCSRDCTNAIPDSPPRYFPRPHKGGPNVMPEN